MLDVVPDNAADNVGEIAFELVADLLRVSLFEQSLWGAGQDTLARARRHAPDPVLPSGGT
jgi:hypothetical protein